MLYNFIHPGSGLGNQLFRIVAGKVLALDKGYEYSAVGREYFKGSSFMNIDFGPENNTKCQTEQPSGKLIPVVNEVRVWEEKTNYYNPEFNFIEDNTIIDGEFQDERYFNHRMKEIDEWLKVNPLKVPNNKCIIGFRGGEFAGVPELFLTQEYWQEAIKKMKKISPYMTFEVHTDDPELAQEFFPGYECIHDIGLNWRSVRYAKYAIIANSSFYILPRLLRHEEGEFFTIAPRYWARRNIEEWSMPQNYYKKFIYI
jgi:hypothetical protein